MVWGKFLGQTARILPQLGEILPLIGLKRQMKKAAGRDCRGPETKKRRGFPRRFNGFRMEPPGGLEPPTY